jgi:hypothetical protein
MRFGWLADEGGVGGGVGQEMLLREPCSSWSLAAHGALLLTLGAWLLPEPAVQTSRSERTWVAARSVLCEQWQGVHERRCERPNCSG